MAKKSGSGGKANFHGTYSCFPEPTDNQGSSTNKGNVRAALNSGDPKSGSVGKVSPLMFRGKDARAEVDDLNEHPKMGQNKIVEITKSSSSFGPADRSYKKGSKK